ncbi:MAG TPA: Crp/Fnr family transcriptional regulator [Spirochaetales bacterium]|nr:Crp/Fnr family transcriptional regulator [Spirochaetales bacterium]
MGGTMNEKIFLAGEAVFREGDPGDVMYVLLAGAVDLKKRVEGGETVLSTVDEPNEFFGEMALIDGRPRSASAVAVKDTKLLVVDRPAFEAMILSNGRFALKIIKVLSERIRSSNDLVSDLIETLPKERIQRGMADFALRTGERIHDGGIKAHLGDMKAWINGRMGIALDDLEAALFRMLKDGAIRWAATSAQTKEHVILPEEFLSRVDRRAADRPAL